MCVDCLYMCFWGEGVVGHCWPVWACASLHWVIFGGGSSGSGVVVVVVVMVVALVVVAVVVVVAVGSGGGGGGGAAGQSGDRMKIAIKRTYQDVTRLEPLLLLPFVGVMAVVVMMWLVRK